MLRRVLLYSAMGLFLVLVVFVLNTSNFLRHPMINIDGPFNKHLKVLEEEIRAEEWDKAGQALTELDKTWRKMAIYMQFSAERDEVISLEHQLIRLRAALTYKDALQAETERALLVFTFHNLGN